MATFERLSEAQLDPSSAVNPIHARAVNPIMTSLSSVPATLSRFKEVQNSVIDEYNGINIEPIAVRSAVIHDETEIYRAISLRFEKLSESQIGSLENLITSTYQTPRITQGLYFDLPSDAEIPADLRNYQRKNPRLTYYIGPNSVEYQYFDNPYQREGLFFYGEERRPYLGSVQTWLDIKRNRQPTSGVLEIHDYGLLTEAELAYFTTMTSLILADKVDLSDQEKIHESLKLRQQVFLRLYRKMILDFIPPVCRDQIIGLNTQIQDIEVNLYGPLTRGDSSAMHTLLVGAPGVGKSLVNRLFVNFGDVLTIPTSASALTDRDPRMGDYIFETSTLENLKRIKANLGLPIVLGLDDTEAILESSAQITSDGKKVENIDFERRSRALNLIERLMDTYNIYLLASLNHPDVEAAFLRRFNPVYFPLPEIHERALAIRSVFPTYGYNETMINRLISDLAMKSHGFNYSGVMEIVNYLGNLVRSNGVHEIGFEEYSKLAYLAVNKARQRMEIDKMAKLDGAARKLTNQEENNGHFAKFIL